jgi:hypothetical protein
MHSKADVRHPGLQVHVLGLPVKPRDLCARGVVGHGLIISPPIQIDASLTNAKWLAVSSQHADIDGAATWCCLLLRVEQTCWLSRATSSLTHIGGRAFEDGAIMSHGY